MSRFDDFIRERRKYLHNVSPHTVSWYVARIQMAAFGITHASRIEGHGAPHEGGGLEGNRLQRRNPRDQCLSALEQGLGAEMRSGMHSSTNPAN